MQNQNNVMQYEKAYLFLIHKLETELPSWLTYHNVQHTKDVLEATQYLAKAENVSGKPYLLLVTAAAYHDVGFTEGYEGHEELSCKIAQQYLPQFDYNSEEIEQVCELIMATQIPQTPKSLLGQILCDADLLYLGTDNYVEIAENLYKEFKKKGIVNDRVAWNKMQHSFLKSHHFFTQTAIKGYAQKKEENFRQFISPI
jgi:HD superfamily phosphodiesterase